VRDLRDPEAVGNTLLRLLAVIREEAPLQRASCVYDAARQEFDVPLVPATVGPLERYGDPRVRHEARK
jgi:hypothetical protein